MYLSTKAMTSFLFLFLLDLITDIALFQMRRNCPFFIIFSLTMKERRSFISLLVMKLNIVQKYDILNDKFLFYFACLIFIINLRVIIFFKRNDFINIIDTLTALPRSPSDAHTVLHSRKSFAFHS